MMYDAMATTDEIASLYFVILLVFGTYILLNLFIAIMVDGFATDPEALARFKKVIMKTREVMQIISSNAMHLAIQVDTAEAVEPPPKKWWQWRQPSDANRIAPAPEEAPLPATGSTGSTQADQTSELLAAFPLPPSRAPTSSQSTIVDVETLSTSTSGAAWPEHPSRRQTFSRMCKTLVSRCVFPPLAARSPSDSPALRGILSQIDVSRVLCGALVDWHPRCDLTMMWCMIVVVAGRTSKTGLSCLY